MKKILPKILIFLILGSAACISFSQALAPQWFLQIGGKGDDRGLKVINDLYGNIYFTGVFQQEASVSSSGYSDTLKSFGREDICIGKINTDGNLVWLRIIGGQGSDAPTDLMPGDNNSIYLSGIFEDSLFIGQDTIESLDYIDSFIAKFDSTGNMIWVNQIGGSGNQQCVSLLTDLEGNLITGGHFTKTLELLQTISEISTSLGGFDGFLVKWTPDGDLEWIKLIQGGGNTFIKDLAVDEDNNYYMLGDFTDTIVNESSQPFLSSYGGADVFIVKYLQNGNFLWQRTVGSLYDDKAKCLTFGGNDKVIMVGEFKDELLSSNHVILNAEGGDDIFQITLNKNGNIGHHKKQGLEKNDFVFDARVPAGQNMLISADLRINEDNSSTLLASFGLLGDIMTVYQDGIDFNPSVLSGLMTEEECVYYCGSFHGNFTLDQLDLFSNGGEDLFLINMAPEELNLSMTEQDSGLFLTLPNIPGQFQLVNNDTIFQAAIEPEQAGDYFYNYPNPFRENTRIVFSLKEASRIKLVISDENGKIIKVLQFESENSGIFSVNYDTRTLIGGLYTCKLIAKGDNYFSSKSIKLICGN